ncbi:MULTISPECIES: hypothetical protein [spotted fever group]|uniref:Uncharacterized protein n=1 Tax=Rickettsia tamurae subsp. buchneri TaxID=1462938 RepID=A0A8E0WLL4_9RICK|nr:MULTISPECIES: hypothetical protein [spotted fever group]EER21279.1 hypothetical protein REIS_0409 [Rickettsia endosymbiont of Ixodes scapularis]KDO02906.1 hypothetical protein REISMN_04610 [Rickettsia tamurae subsp. buchneri]
MKSKNLDEGQKFIITELGKSVILFKKPSGDTKSFLETLETKDFFIVISAISLLIRTIANNEIQVKRGKIFSYIEVISQSKNEEEKNTNITIIDEQKHTNLDAFASSTKGKGDVLLNSGSDANPLITEEQKNLISIALKLELQDILSKKPHMSH